MEEKKFDEIMSRYGKQICSNNLNSSDKSKAYLYADESSYPVITMRHIAIKCLEEEDIVDIHKSGFYSTLKSKKKFRKILNSLNPNATSNKIELYNFMGHLIGHEYNAGQGFNIRFEQKNSNLEIILEKRKN